MGFLGWFFSQKNPGGFVGTYAAVWKLFLSHVMLIYFLSWHWHLSVISGNFNRDWLLHLDLINWLLNWFYY